MTFEIGLVLGILAVAIVLFVTETFRVDAVALLVLATLAVTDLITPEQALSGFSNPAVVTVWAVFILSGGLARTGVAGMIGSKVLQLAGEGEARLVVVIMITSASLSAFMNNVGVAALLLPVVMDISERTGRAPSRLLIPLASSSLLGGMTTLIGTPPNLLVAEALADAGGEPFSMFDFTPVGIMVVLAGIIYMAVAGRHLLPRRDPARESARSRVGLPQLYELAGDLSLVRLPADSALDGSTLAESRLGSTLGIDVVGIFRDDATELAPGPASVLRAGDRLLVRGALDRLHALRGREYLLFAEESFPVERLVSADIEIAEIHCGRGSPFIGRSLMQLAFRNTYGAIVLAIRRAGKTNRTEFKYWPLQADDVLLVQATTEQLAGLGSLAGVEVEIVEQVDAYRLERRMMVMQVPGDSSLAGKTLAESRLGAALRVRVLSILREGETLLMPGPDERVEAGDTLLIKGRRESLAAVEELRRLEIGEGDVAGLDHLESDRTGMAEVVLSPRTSLAGRTLRDLGFRDKYGLTVMAVSREGSILRTGLRNLPLRFGDALLLYGPRRRLQMLAREPDFLVLTMEAQEPVDRVRAPIAALIMAAVVVTVLTSWLPIYIAAVSGAVLMVLTGCLSMDEAYRAIEWRAVFLIAGMLPMGIAMEQTGAAHWITDRTIGLLGNGSPVLIVATLYVVTALGAQVMPTSAAAILMAPIAINLAADLGLSREALLMTVALSASASFMSPIAHPANVLVMGAGGYRFKDYLRVGLPLMLVSLGVVVVFLPIFWPLQG